MASKLGSYLIRHGTLTAGQLSEAATAHVLRGGTLDTALLECGLADEPTLIAALSQITGLPPITPELLAGLDATLGAKLDEQTAVGLGVCPIKLDGARMLLACAERADRYHLDELGQSLGCTIEPYVATELRVKQASAAVYRHPLDRRFQSLLDGRDDLLAPANVDAAEARDAEPEPESEPESTAAAASTSGPEPEADSRPTSEYHIIRPERRPTREPAPRDAALGGGGGSAAPASSTTRVDPPRRETDEYPAIMTNKIAAERVHARRRRATPQVLHAVLEGEGADELRTITVAQASGVLPQAGSRDEVLKIVLRCAHGYLNTVHVYAVQRNMLVGRYSVEAGKLDRAEVRARRIPLKVPSIVGRTVRDGQPFIGATPDDDASSSVLLMAKIRSPNVVLIPISVKQRTVGMILGHHHGEAPAEVAEPLSSLARDAADALVTMILRRKELKQTLARSSEGAARGGGEEPPG